MLNFNREVRRGPMNKTPFKQRCRRDKKANQAVIWKKSILLREKSKHTVWEARVLLMNLRYIK